jgi:DNA-binding transcriptional LysR family regulator
MPNVVKHCIARELARKAQPKAARFADEDEEADYLQSWEGLLRDAEQRVLGVIFSAAMGVTCEAPVKSLALRRAAENGAYIVILNTVVAAAEAAAAKAAGFETWAAFEEKLELRTGLGTKVGSVFD